jgi:hypothetical protein
MALSNTESLSFPYDLYKAMQKDNLGYIYRGHFTQEITDNILALTENNLEKEEQSSKIKKRVYSILVECLQNITRHQDDAKEEGSDNNGLFVIQKNQDKYFITTGNLVHDVNIPHLKSLIEKINSLEKEELKEYYKTVLEEGTLSDKGGAGLGLIDMARKSGNKLLYEFVSVGHDLSYFYLHTIPTLEEGAASSTGLSEGAESLKNIITIHQTLNQEEVLLVFNGAFNQESLLVLLASLEGQMTGTVSNKKKVFYIVVEMLQNIVKHGYNPGSGQSGNPGLFVIGEKNGVYSIVTGNYICESRVEELKNKLDNVNSLQGDALEQYYNNSLFDFDVDDSKKAGLGIIDLRIKSGNTLLYHFKEESKEHSFLSLKAVVNGE